MAVRRRCGLQPWSQLANRAALITLTVWAAGVLGGGLIHDLPITYQNLVLALVGDADFVDRFGALLWCLALFGFAPNRGVSRWGFNGGAKRQLKETGAWPEGFKSLSASWTGGQALVSSRSRVFRQNRVPPLSDPPWRQPCPPRPNRASRPSARPILRRAGAGRNGLETKW